MDAQHSDAAGAWRNDAFEPLRHPSLNGRVATVFIHLLISGPEGELVMWYDNSNQQLCRKAQQHWLSA